MRYRIVYKDHGGRGCYRDVESNSLAHAVWELAKELCGSGELIDTMQLPSKETSSKVPVHVNLYPDWTPEQ